MARQKGDEPEMTFFPSSQSANGVFTFLYMLSEPLVSIIPTQYERTLQLPPSSRFMPWSDYTALTNHSCMRLCSKIGRVFVLHRGLAFL
jgi:hypothetical protein